ncbi:outer membrane beta-barrel protein [Pedobacter metabolipauper]|uniref:Outer membrane receptor protein involved in Fe transport n=1 Tax=Pedobacter metabolipauper TaxID=425513 RepID=A0A4R6SXT7_9SPHI|nr:outer membrane beta-barrel protein [Pedobacter metabolipauper]TDQ09484.1 outer membrane receptor protein involved in Fe transport [Pedobacter metabolipauper]
MQGYSQHNFAAGKIIDSTTNRPIKNVSIKVYDEKKIIGYFSGDSLGHFKIPVLLLNGSTHVDFQATDYKNLLYTNKNKGTLSDQTIFIGLFKMKPDIVNLKEVVISQPKRYRDTINIKLHDQVFERSIMIDDLFSGKLGFYKDNNGKLYYNGKLVSDVLVNGADFFGKNNMEIYKNLPALVLNDVDIIETDIDSLTNVTLLRPTIKVNLKLKDKYKGGKFGTANLGAGSLSRYTAGADLYMYNKSQQLSLFANSNNVNLQDGSGQEPNISFSSNGNNTQNSSSSMMYRNLFYKNKIEFNAFLKGKINSTKFESISERRDEILGQLSNTFTSSNLKKASLEAANLYFNYAIDSLNRLKLSQVTEYNDNRQLDSLSYLLTVNNSTNNSGVNKLRNSDVLLSVKKIEYQKKFSKKGRIANIVASLSNRTHNVNENNLVVEQFDLAASKYIFEGIRNLVERTTDLNSEFTEPIGNDGFIKFLLTYRKEKLNLEERLIKDGLSNSDIFEHYSYNYLKQGVKIYKNLNNLALDATFIGITNIRQSQIEKETFFNIDAVISVDYKLIKQRKLFGQYSRTTNYPNVNQLTSINNSFDIISQQLGNAELKPEVKNKLEFTYDLKRTDSLTLELTGNLERFSSKFGLNISSSPGITQSVFFDNMGNSNNAEVAFSMSSTSKGSKNFNYRIGLSYVEMPGFFNDNKEMNRSINTNQMLSTNRVIIRDVLSISPAIAVSASKYYYQKNSNNQYNITYLDRILLKLFNLQLTVAPLINYNYNLTNNFSFASNMELKRSFLKDYGHAWIKVYDIFNTYAPINNLNTSFYTQSVRFSNLNRYFLIGASIKFNNLK